ncbi:MAG: molybdopterin-binding/glycosyltransferase family 2 protein [Alphaproteobacteria bacterium]|nr:molybdopterin-binding/glycosyltransferase family 2 protein [Alphaproteobacteria bacterium]
MIFGDLPLAQAEGAILAHSVRAGALAFNKGRVLSPQDIADLHAAGITDVIIAKLEAGDVGEDAAANALAQACAGVNIRRGAAFTGRANLFAATDGLAVIDRALVDQINLIDESITIATVTPYEPVGSKQMVATIKIIPFATPREKLDQALTLLKKPLVQIAPWRARRVGLVSTMLAGGKNSLLDKNIQALTGRLAHMGDSPVVERRCPHDANAVAGMIGELMELGCAPVFIFGASAIVDRRDVIPAGIVAAGGEVLHLGMPVDPGNLLLLGRVRDVPVVGLPSCARSPKLNGFDWVLQRLMADVPVTREDIMRMGAGGLLKEIPTRPQPRAGRAPTARKAPRIAALVLAAGRSQRMGAENKLLIKLDGQFMIARVVGQIAAAGLDPCVIVTGHEAADVRVALGGGAVIFAHNPDYAEGLSSSLHTGLKALPEDVDGVLICLGDMPDVRTAHVQRLIAAFDPVEGRAICVPTFQGKRGNPVLFGAQFFEEMMAVAGDTGAKHLIGEYSELVCEVAMEDAAILLDIDTPQAMSEYQNLIQPHGRT